MWSWLDAHQGSVTALATVAVTLVATVLAILVWRALRQGRRALLGAQPVPRPLTFVPSPDGGLHLVAHFENMAAWPATQLAVSARVEGEELEGGLGDAGLFGVSADGSTAAGCQARFAWPVGMLDGDVEVRWRWRDGAGRHAARWEGAVRVPDTALPSDAGRPPTPGRTFGSPGA